ncbi:caveolin-2 [Latimeria chalumnae]|uniref:Caveolin n=1 Tax=Latimeria chalumnae TaxID=7897 RepID=H3AWR5_LATCH|nr:PREDICTED: caveolin-2 [Latimeria chalumnae]|eukprot:XP_005996738.1 PREDICTED: caveolin-2 [Latimeria chalumnae]
MGLEKEKRNAKIIMDEDEFSKMNEAILSEKKSPSSESLADRDPRQLNSHLKFEFVDVIAEPDTTHSFDKVWICSNACFEVIRFVIYKFLTLFLAIPLSLIAGILFAVLSSLHIWFVMPCVKSCLLILPVVQTVWKSITEAFVSPVCESVGQCFSAVSLHVDKV